MFLNYRRQNAFFIFFFSQGYVQTESRYKINPFLANIPIL